MGSNNRLNNNKENYLFRLREGAARVHRNQLSNELELGAIVEERKEIQITLSGVSCGAIRDVPQQDGSSRGHGNTAVGHARSQATAQKERIL